MTPQPATHSHGGEESIIPARRESVTNLWAGVFLAVLAAIALRLLFVLWFPGSADDSEIYLQLARNWADHHVYGLTLNDQLAPTDLRTPGYPAFLAGVALLLGRSMRAILLSQAALDVLTCILTAALAGTLAPAGSRRRVAIIALWIAATCPFLANYAAVVLTETLVTFLATAALACFALGLRDGAEILALHDSNRRVTPFAWALLGAFLTGLATLVRPEMPLLLAAAGVVYAFRGLTKCGVRKTLLLGAAMGAVFVAPLLPWAARNYVTLKKAQFLAPRYAILPGEYAPVGFYAWTGTWLERYRDVYYTVWKLGNAGQPLLVEEMPPAAFDSPEEKARVAALFAQYNDSGDDEISPEVDAQFAAIARERTERNPLRTYLRVPFERALSIWFAPRAELLPIDGKFFPVREQWADSHADVIVTGSFAVLGYLYVACAAAGVWWVWRVRRSDRGEPEGSRGAVPLPLDSSETGANLWGITLVLVYLIARTAFLTTIEAPEPRYVVSCYPAVLALVALLGSRL